MHSNGMKVKFLRYSVLEQIAKILTPKFYKILLKSYIDEVIHPTSSVFHYRPSINYIMKNHSIFQNKRLLGAEIGTNYGRNALNILSVLDIEMLYLIDIWDFNNNQFNSERAYRNVRSLFSKNDKVCIIRSDSANTVDRFRDNSLDFVYIDADHHYERAYQDIALWDRKVKVNGIVSGHDIKDLEVYQAVKNYCKMNNRVMRIAMPDWYYYKVSQD